MLTLTALLPLAGVAVLLAWRTAGETEARRVAIGTAALPLLLLVAAWARFDPAGPQFQLEEEAPWIPTLGVAWRMGVDGIALALASMTAVVFLAAIVHPTDTKRRPHAWYAWLLFLEAVSLTLFLTLDLLIFYVCFDLGLVGMYFVIARFGHADARRSALKFFLYTLAGSLVMLLAILGLVLASEPLTFDMRVLIARQPLAGAGVTASLVFLGFMFGLGVKTPMVPVHTWLPPAHVDAPGPGSAILAAVLLKMGTYGMVRIPYAMMRETFGAWALPVAIVAVVSILYGALVAFGQRDLKRRIAYTSVNHMGYAVLGIAAAAGMPRGEEAARTLALVGSTVEMVAHGLITGALFLIAGSFWQRAQEYDLDAYGGLARRTPLLAGTTMLAAFASLGLPGLAGFVGEVQIFVGTFAVWPWLAAVALLGVLITAALFLHLLQQLFLGELPERWRSFPDLGVAERISLGALLAGVVAIGVYPRFLLGPVHAAAAALVGGR